jgi:hypothetical protein
MMEATAPIVTPGLRAPAWPAPTPSFSLTPLGTAGAACEEVVAMVVEASLEPDICEKSYLPARMDADRARQYCAHANGVVIRVGGKPVGVAMAHPDPDPGQGVEIPAGCAELEVWVLAAYRGQTKLWYPMMMAWMAARFDRLISVIWADNHAPTTVLRRNGWAWLGQSDWSDGGCSGRCDVFLYDLAPHRAPTT